MFIRKSKRLKKSTSIMISCCMAAGMIQVMNAKADEV